MRYNFVVFVLAVTCGSAFAQQHVVRNALDPMKRGGTTNFSLCTFAWPVPAGDPCEVAVYSTSEIESLLKTTKAAALAECKQNIDTAKGELATDINKLPSAAVDALKAQVKEELKAEILKEVLDAIKNGSLKLPPGASVGPKRN